MAGSPGMVPQGKLTLNPLGAERCLCHIRKTLELGIQLSRNQMLAPTVGPYAIVQSLRTSPFLICEMRARVNNLNDSGENEEVTESTNTMPGT